MITTTWNPSKEFISAISNCYQTNQRIDLTKFSAEDWVKALECSDKTESLLNNHVTKESIYDFIWDMHRANKEIDLESLCCFGNISFVINFLNIEDFEKLVTSLRYVIDNKVSMKDQIFDYKICELINFHGILEDISYFWFENWQKEHSVIVGATFVDLCDYLKVDIQPLNKSIVDWNIEVDEIEYIAKTYPKEVEKFSRLFSEPMKNW